MKDLTEFSYALDSLTVYHMLTAADSVLSALGALLHALETKDGHRILRQYAAFTNALLQTGKSLPDHLWHLIRVSDNPFAAAAARLDQDEKPLLTAAARDLSILWAVGRISPTELKAQMAAVCPTHTDWIGSLPEYAYTPETAPESDWGNEVAALRQFHRTNGCGVFAEHEAFLYEPDKTLRPILHRDPIRLSDLKHYEVQRKQAIENTRALLQGYPFQNILLYGDRGTGKSSTVKALLNEYAGEGLRMIQVTKESLVSLGELMGRLAPLRCKFIVFLDDLTFTEDDDSFGALKAVLEGGLSARPQNMAIYATTNRRHLIKETFSARSGDEVHRADTLDETISLSDRFGMLLTFTAPNRDIYLDIVEQLARDRGLSIPAAQLRQGAEQFSLRKSGRSPRLARQYVDRLEAEWKLTNGGK